MVLANFINITHVFFFFFNLKFEWSYVLRMFNLDFWTKIKFDFMYNEIRLS